MNGDGVDGRPARSTGVLATFVAAAVASALGSSLGVGRSTFLALLGSALLAAGAWGLEESSHARQAGGSIAATGSGAVCFGLCVLAVGGPHGWLPPGLFLALSLVAVDATIGFEWERVRAITEVLSENVRAVLVGFTVAAVGYVVIAFDVIPLLLGWVFAVSTSTPLAGFVTLQLFALSVALLVPRAVSILERWISDDDSARDGVLGSVEAAGIRFDDVPRGYTYALLFQIAVAFVPPANALFGLFVGGIPAAVLTSGVLHALLGVLLLVLLAVLAGAAVRWCAIAWFGAVPAETLAAQAGAVGSILVALIVGFLVEYLPDSPVLDTFVPLVTGRYGLIGFPAVALFALVLGLVVVIILLEICPAIARLGFAPDRATGFALGSGSIFVLTLSAATAGISPFVVFVGVAGSLLVWDLGAHATSVGRQLGQVADTRRSEFVHATGSTLVLTGAVAVATLASYVVLPAVAPTGTQGTSGLAALSMILVLAAILAFVTAVHLRGEPSEA